MADAYWFNALCMSCVLCIPICIHALTITACLLNTISNPASSAAYQQHILNTVKFAVADIYTNEPHCVNSSKMLFAKVQTEDRAPAVKNSNVACLSREGSELGSTMSLYCHRATLHEQRRTAAVRSRLDRNIRIDSVVVVAKLSAS